MPTKSTILPKVMNLKIYALDRDMTPEQQYAVISEEIDDIYANG